MLLKSRSTAAGACPHRKLNPLILLEKEKEDTKKLSHAYILRILSKNAYMRKTQQISMRAQHR